MQRVTLIVTGLCLAATARADVVRSFVLNPGQVVPPSGSPAAGSGRATLNTAETQLSFAVQHGAEGTSLGNATLHLGDWGINGPSVFTLTYVNSNSFNGTWNIDSSGVAAFHAGELYVSVNTPEYPGGAIRGQIDLNPDPQPGDVIISEIMYNPLSPEGDFPNGKFTSNAEWVELFNTTFTDINIGGWFLQDEDVDTNGDACTPMRSGSIPDFVLPSFQVAVIIPDGEEVFGFMPSVADFKAAWGLTATTAVLQVDTNGTANGALVGRNLSNDPANDTFAINDLPLNAPFWYPCDPLGFEREDNEILTLNDGSQIIDVVNYDDDFPFTSDWPGVGGYNSITIVPDDYPDATSFESYTALGNDFGYNWIAHEIGDDALGFEQVAAVGVYGGGDVGSPGRLRGATTGNLPPASVSGQVIMTPGQTKDIFLQATDRTRPFFGLLLYIIKSLPQNGQLIDVASNKVITPAMLGANGYLMPRIPFNHVRYINNGTCGLDGFTFSASDGLLESQPVPVELFVQCGDVVITEVMYNPDSTENNPALAEWVEIYNNTDSPLNLAGWYLADNFSRSGEFPAYVLGAYSTVVIIPWAASTSEFNSAWSAPYIKPTLIGMTGTGGVAGSNLNNSGETLYLVKPGGPVKKVTDVVVYRSGFEDSAWPTLSPDGPSIYVLPTAGYTAAANDDPAAWGKSAIGLHGAYTNTFTAEQNGFDIGSPGYLHGVFQGHCPASGPMRDGNGDGVVDLADFEHFVMCLYGPQEITPQNCACFDSDVDTDVDLRDFDAMQRNLNTPPPPVSELLISEVMDGTLTNGEPKFIEITNCGDTAVDLAEFRIALYANGSTAENFLSMDYGDMPVMLGAGETFVIANDNSGPGDSFLSVYGVEADFYDPVANGNGNDVYHLLKSDGQGGDLTVDAFGVRGVDGTGQAWEYLDSHAFSLPGRAPNSGIFNPLGWFFAGPDALDGFSPAQIAAATSAGTHTCD